MFQFSWIIRWYILGHRRVICSMYAWISSCTCLHNYSDLQATWLIYTMFLPSLVHGWAAYLIQGINTGLGHIFSVQAEQVTRDEFGLSHRSIWRKYHHLEVYEVYKNGGVPPTHPFLIRFSIINHPAIGVTPRSAGAKVTGFWLRGRQAARPSWRFKPHNMEPSTLNLKIGYPPIPKIQ